MEPNLGRLETPTQFKVSLGIKISPDCQDFRSNNLIVTCGT